MYTYTGYNLYGAVPLLLLPLLNPFCPFLCPLYLLWNPPCCDRIRPPWSQVTPKLTSPSSPFPIPSPLQIPSTQVTKRLTKMTSRIRLFLSGTIGTPLPYRPILLWGKLWQRCGQMRRKCEKNAENVKQKARKRNFKGNSKVKGYKIYAKGGK